MLKVTELNFAVLLDNNLIELAEVFSPHVNAPALDVHRISGNINLPKTSSLTLTSYLDMDEGDDDSCPIYKKLMSM